MRLFKAASNVWLIGAMFFFIDTASACTWTVTTTHRKTGEIKSFTPSEEGIDIDLANLDKGTEVTCKAQIDLWREYPSSPGRQFQDTFITCSENDSNTRFVGSARASRKIAGKAKMVFPARLSVIGATGNEIWIGVECN